MGEAASRPASRSEGDPFEALGAPTLENLSRFVWERVQHAGRVTQVTIHRDSCGESCAYYGPQG